ncbi:MAG TPA: hypothetical protein VNZ49_17550 [Bacteroidia bacterium]|jgi:hypothetical protein|nr:hypothetical protein [Bacteroidia bacterium]
MTKKELIEKFYQNHKELSDYINSLPADKFIHGQNGKWTPGQQLSHIYLCLKPISQALTSKEFIEKKFGKISRSTMDYDAVINLYYKKDTKSGIFLQVYYIAYSCGHSDCNDYTYYDCLC